MVGEGQLLGDFKKEVLKAEEQLKRRVGVGNSISTASVRDYLRTAGISEYAIDRCLNNWQRRGALVYSNQGKVLQRVLP